MIKNIERFHCGRCGFITEDKNAIKRIKETDTCPACNNGKAKGWTKEYTSPLE